MLFKWHTQSHYINADSRNFYHFLEISSSLFPALSDMVLRYRCRFGSTYICEKTVSIMNLVKSKYRSIFTDHQKFVDSCHFIRETQHWITGEREGYPKDFIKPGVFHVNASLVRHFWIIFAVNFMFLIQVLEWLFCCNSIIFPLNNNIFPFSRCFTWSIGST